MLPDPVSPVSADEGRAILASLRRLREAPPPSNPASPGCFAALVAIAGLVALPFVAPRFSIGSATTWIIAAGLALVLVVGALLSVFGGSFVTGGIASDADEAAEQLIAEFPDGDVAGMREAAVRILGGANSSQGPTTVNTFDAHEMAERLGAALPYVKRIERFLLKEQQIYPVFTDTEDT